VRRASAAVSLGAAAALALAGGCMSERAVAADGQTPRASTGSCRIAVGSPVVGAVQAVVAIDDFKFVPDTLRVPVGTTVTWVNCGEPSIDEPHTATSDGQQWSSDLIAPAGSYSRRFDEAGTFPYHCEPHPFMKATVIVR
jgi:plastocyanin